MIFHGASESAINTVDWFGLALLDDYRCHWVDMPGEAVKHRYEVPFRFTGTIKQVVTDISGELIDDDEAKVRMLMANQ